jgi:hypothetical protein
MKKETIAQANARYETERLQAEDIAKRTYPHRMMVLLSQAQLHFDLVVKSDCFVLVQIGKQFPDHYSVLPEYSPNADLLLGDLERAVAVVEAS